jgi:4-hydroxythreonine-4-phosphate dehydrogenase
MGYPAGIGPEVIIKALASQKVKRLASFLIVGDSFVMEKASKLCKKHIGFGISRDDVSASDFRKNSIILYDMRNVSENGFRFGKLSEEYGGCSIEYIKKAVELTNNGSCDCLVTAPIHKYAAELSGFQFFGHTEFLAYLTRTKDFAMMLTGGGLKVVLATTHLPLKDVSAGLKRNDIYKKIILTHKVLRRNFRIKGPVTSIFLFCARHIAGDIILVSSVPKRPLSPA